MNKWRASGCFGKELVYWIGTCVSRSRSQLFLLKFSLRDDDDEFLYGDSELKESSLSMIPADLIVAPVPTTGETPLLLLYPATRVVFYSSTKYNRHFAHFFPVCAR
jgi:hypothetical protein